ncbi:MAG: hypothetical protein JKY65_30810 [Planctomycetes bacterium]|nr:hypothetical protein [Planctomycetota bacterium]
MTPKGARRVAGIGSAIDGEEGLVKDLYWEEDAETWSEGRYLVLVLVIEVNGELKKISDYGSDIGAVGHFIWP